MLHVSRLLVSATAAAMATVGFIKAVGATEDWSLLLLFAGFWIGIHAFFGFVRFSKRLDRVARLNLLSAEDYARLDEAGRADTIKQPGDCGFR